MEKLGRLTADIDIPSAVAPAHIEADLRTLRAEASIEIGAPELVRATARVNWLLRQLRGAPADARIDARFVQSRATTSELLGSLRGGPNLLVDPVPKPPRSFIVTLGRPVGGNRGAGRNSFIDSVTALLHEFHATIASDLRNWSPPKSDAGDTVAPPKSASQESDAEAATAQVAESTQSTEVPGADSTPSPPP